MQHTMSRRAFTLIELLIVVAMIAVLVGIVAVSLRGVGAAARRTESLGALRQMAMGYTSYTQDYRGQLLPGYIDVTLFAPGEPFENLSISLPSGEEIPPADMQSYVWRLAPYMDNTWRTFFQDMSDAGLMAEFTADYQKLLAGNPPTSSFAGGISERPSFGLNSIFLGGDSLHGGAAVNGLHPWTGNSTVEPIAATRLSTVVNPTRVIVFAPTAKADPGGSDAVFDTSVIGRDGTEVGFCELRPPFLDGTGTKWQNRQWMIGAHGLMVATPSDANEGAGLPIARTARDMVRGGSEPFPVAHLDVSTSVQPLVELSNDMRRWDPSEVQLRGTDQ